MKKFLYSLLITVFSILFFVGCTNANTNSTTSQITLDTPLAPVIEKADNKIYVSTNAVNNASSYQFSINNIFYTVKTNTFDCTDHLVESGVYTFRVVAIGDGEKYSNSYVSPATNYVVTEQLSSPTISVYNNNLHITSIQNATSYEIYINNNLAKTSTETVVSLSDLTFKTGINTIKVKAIGNQVYLDSEISNEASYEKFDKLSKVENINVLKQNAKYMLSFDEVANADKYEVIINDEEVVESDKNLIDITNKLNKIGKYELKIKAYSNNKYYLEAEVADYNYSKTEKLNTPQLNYTLDIKYVQFDWNAVENAKTYSMYINNQVYSRFVWSETNNKVISLISKEYLNRFIKPLNISIIANGYDNYLDSDFSNIVRINSYGAFATPENLQINVVDSEIRLSYDFIEHAQDYTILINDGEYIKISSTYYVDLTDIITEAITYKIKVKANASDYFDASEYSEELEFLNLNVLDTPQNPTIEIENNIARLSWEEVKDASYYVVKFITYDKDKVIRQKEIKDIKNTTLDISLTTAGKYGFNVIAINAESGVASLPSLTVTENNYQKLNRITDLSFAVFDEETKQITITWGDIDNAVSYTVYVNVNGNLTIITDLTETNYSLQYETDEYELYTFYVVAIAEEDSYWGNSLPSNIIRKPHGEIQDGEQYYYNGNISSTIIRSQEDFNNIISYKELIKEQDFELNFDFSYFDITSDLSDGYYLDYKDYIASKTDVEYLQEDETILNEFLTALYSYNRDIGGVKSFEIPEKTSNNTYHFHIEYYCDGVNFTPTTQTYTQNNLDYKSLTLQEMGLTKRASGYNDFKIENLTKYELVKSSDQLLNVVMYYGRKPIFGDNLELEEIYNSAKAVLREIISDSMTEFQKICAIYDYLIYNTCKDKKYRELEEEQQYSCISNYLEGVFKNKVATSMGIAKAFSLLCGLEGINSRYVVGYSTKDKVNEPYAINKVQLDNTWYVVDIFSNILEIGGVSIPSHYFNFLVGDNDIKNSQKVHFTQQSIVSEVATSKYDYYSHQEITSTDDLYIESTEEFERVLNNYLALSKTGIEFKIPTNVDTNTIINEIISIISAKTEINKSIIIQSMYSTNQLYLIKIKF